MSLTSLSCNAQVGWSLENSTVTGFSTAKESDSLQWGLALANLTTVNQVYVTKLTLAASAASTINLTSLSNLVSESFSFGHVLGLIVLPTGAGVTVEPGASSGLPWMLGGTTPTITVNAGGLWVWSDPSTPGTTVDGTHKNITITNLSGSATAIVKLAIFGSTT